MTTGGVFLKKIEWVSIDNPDTAHPTLINDAISFTVEKSIEIKNNLFTLNLKNSPINYDSYDSVYYGDYVNSSDFSPKFSQFDQFSVYCKHSDTPGDVENANWNTSNDLVGVFAAQEVHTSTNNDSTQMTMQTVDSAFYLFNKVHNFVYGVGNSFTSPGAIRKICRLFTQQGGTSNIQKFKGTHYDYAVDYTLDSRFVSEGGYILDYRRPTEDSGPSCLLNGDINSTATTITVDTVSGTFKAANGTLVIGTEHIAYSAFDGTDFTGCTRGIDDTENVAHSNNDTVYQGFPLILLTKNWAALFEWFQDLSSWLYTNYVDEVGSSGTPFYNRSFIYWVDANNSLHYVPAQNDNPTTITLPSESVREWRLEKSVFDAINFVIYNAGSDMYGHGIIYYYYNDSANVAGLKMRYQPWPQISNEAVNNDLRINTPRSTASSQDKLKQFPSSYPVSNWAFKQSSNLWRGSKYGGGAAARTTLANDTEYNDSLREACKWEGLNRSIALTNRMSGLRWVGQIALKGTIYTPGDLLRLTNKMVGVNSQLLRILSVSHRVNRNSWETTLKVEEDEKTLFGENYP